MFIVYCLHRVVDKNHRLLCTFAILARDGQILKYYSDIDIWSTARTAP